MSAALWLRQTDEGLTIALQIQPGAKRTEVVGAHGDALKIKVQAPPVDGAANEALLAFLAKALGVKARDVKLLRGATSRQKVVLVTGVTPAAAALALQPPPAAGGPA
jgi:uncharacterized protein (TIGR00251 family)